MIKIDIQETGKAGIMFFIGMLIVIIVVFMSGSELLVTYENETFDTATQWLENHSFAGSGSMSATLDRAHVKELINITNKTSTTLSSANFTLAENVVTINGVWANGSYNVSYYYYYNDVSNLGGVIWLCLSAGILIIGLFAIFKWINESR